MSSLLVDDSPLKKRSRASDEEMTDTCTSSSAEVLSDGRGVIEPREVVERRRYEYLDHPADIQLHSWGSNLQEALSALMMAMYGYMTDLSKVDEVYPYFITGRGHDLHTAIFSFMEEALCVFQSEPFFVAKRFEILSIDMNSFVIEGVGYGESFDLETKHTQEGDIKAITYSNMQVIEEKDKTDLFVIVDI
ncbi:unnamed protein product, partial [Mesorhabditis belari]|uniref:Protein archease-like n=1 Tax=Mesorhabditis belari TaxID=2138241 RepID=A0AAF3F2B7_9BILA